MGLFKLFTPKVDPLVSWRAEPGQTIEFGFDFDHHTLCGVKLGDPIALLWKLGPSEDKPAEAGGFHNYYSKGVEVDVEDGKVVSFVLFFNDEQQKKFLPFKSRCIFRGQALELRAGLSEIELKTVFGEPYWCDADDDETILFYEFVDIEWQVEIDNHNGLTAFVVLTQPVLADEAQRNSLHVTKPWPPQIN